MLNHLLGGSYKMHAALRPDVDIKPFCVVCKELGFPQYQILSIKNQVPQKKSTVLQSSFQ